MIQTDSSLTGWAAACQEDKASGSWSQEEKLQISISRAESAFFGIKLYVKSGTHVLIQQDNITALRFLSKYGGTHSLTLCNFAIEILTYIMQRQILVTAEYFPRKENITADTISRLMDRDESDWRLHHPIFNKIVQHFNVVPTIDLFASRLNTRFNKFVSWRPDPEALAVNAFTWVRNF